MKFLTITILLLANVCARAQQTFNGWFFSSHDHAITKKWSINTDIQFRSSNQLHHLETILLRPGINYQLTEKSKVGAGYAYLYTKDVSDQNVEYEYENRTWEQYILELEAGPWAITNRVRLEQRFIRKAGSTDFSQRARYYVRGQVPLNGNKITAGWYVALQNEVFLNIQNKQLINNSVFDQNRLFVAPGFKFNKHIELEAGYLYRYQVEQAGKAHNHIFQVVLNTSL